MGLENFSWDNLSKMKEIQILENLTGKKVTFVEQVEDVDFEGVSHVEYLQKLVDEVGLPHTVKHYIGEGSYGIVGVLEDGSVIKFDTSKNQADILKQIVGKNFKHIVKVYGVYDITYKLNSGKKAKGWLVHKQFVPYLDRDIEYVIAQLEEDDFDTAMIEEVNIRMQVEELEDELRSLGRKLWDVDFNPNNVGWLNGKIVLFDPLG